MLNIGDTFIAVSTGFMLAVRHIDRQTGNVTIIRDGETWVYRIDLILTAIESRELNRI